VLEPETAISGLVVFVAVPLPVPVPDVIAGLVPVPVVVLVNVVAVPLPFPTPARMFEPSPAAATVAVAMPPADPLAVPATGAAEEPADCKTIEPPAVACGTPLGEGDPEPEDPPDPGVSGSIDGAIPPAENEAGSVLSGADTLSEPIDTDSTAQASD